MDELKKYKLISECDHDCIQCESKKCTDISENCLICEDISSTCSKNKCGGQFNIRLHQGSTFKDPALILYATKNKDGSAEFTIQEEYYNDNDFKSFGCLNIRYNNKIFDVSSTKWTCSLEDICKYQGYLKTVYGAYSKNKREDCINSVSIDKKQAKIF